MRCAAALLLCLGAEPTLAAGQKALGLEPPDSGRHSPCPAMLLSYDEAGVNQYRAACEAAGKRNVGSGSTSMIASLCASFNCMPLPEGTDSNGFQWGDTLNQLKQLTGWCDTVMHGTSSSPNLEQKVCYNSNSYYVPKRPICARED